MRCQIVRMGKVLVGKGLVDGEGEFEYSRNVNYAIS